MGRPAATAGGRPIVVTVRFSEAEVARLDLLRGSLSRSEFLRVLMSSLEKG